MSVDSSRAPGEVKQKRRESCVTLTLLCSLLILFCLRVAGQLLVAAYQVPYLPPMQEWQSGLLPYPVLLFCQILIIGLYGKICFNFYRRDGFFYTPTSALAAPLMKIAVAYFLAVALRLLIWTTIFQHHPWFSGTIPIFFHFVLSTFLIVLAKYHCRVSTPTARFNSSQVLTGRQKVSL